MDLSYILYNTLVYGLIAFAFSCFFAYGKYLNLTIGAAMIFIGYCLQAFITQGFSRGLLGWSVAIIAVYRGVNQLITKQFTNEKQRDLFGLIFTLGGSIFIENSINYIFGPSSVSLSGMSLSLPLLIGLFIVCNVAVIYLLRHTYAGVVLQGIQERNAVIRTLGVRSHQWLTIVFSFVLMLLVCIAFLILVDGNMRASDSLFYVIKGLGIMILVGVGHKRAMLFGALLYVILEYLMFITRGLPIAYKETLILVIILGVLLYMPQGLFALRKRRV